MVKKADAIIVDGVVSKVLPGTNFEVTIEEGVKVMAHIAGKMRTNFVRLVPGDKVSVELSPYDMTKGRIIFRHRG